MKKLIIFFIHFFIFCQDSDLKKELQKAIDFYDVSLYDESKILLLDLLHTDKGKEYEVEIRYHLGLASYFSDKKNDAFTQWGKIINNFPQSKRAQELNRIYSNESNSRNENNYFKSMDFEFAKDYETSNYFWSSKDINRKLYLEKLEDGGRATRFYSQLIQKYDDPKKRFICYTNIVLLKAGFNNNDYGFKSERGLRDPLNKDHIMRVNHYLKKMEEQLINEEIDPNHNILIEVYYLVAMKLSGSNFLDDNVKITDQSKPFFNRVIELTANKTNNIYRLFTEHWIAINDPNRRIRK